MIKINLILKIGYKKVIKFFLLIGRLILIFGVTSSMLKIIIEIVLSFVAIDVVGSGISSLIKNKKKDKVSLKDKISNIKGNVFNKNKKKSHTKANDFDDNIIVVDKKNDNIIVEGKKDDDETIEDKNTYNNIIKAIYCYDNGHGHIFLINKNGTKSICYDKNKFRLIFKDLKNNYSDCNISNDVKAKLLLIKKGVLFYSSYSVIVGVNTINCTCVLSNGFVVPDNKFEDIKSAIINQNWVMIVF